MSRTQLLFVCAGLGMGNASRTAAIIEAMGDTAGTIHVVSWGAGYRFLHSYFSDRGAKVELTKIGDYRGGAGGLLAGPLTYIKNVYKIFRLVKKVRPRVILLDSDYHVPAYLGAQAPLVFVGQAYDVVCRAQEQGYSPRSLFERMTFYLREYFDYWLQRALATKVLVPTFLRREFAVSKFLGVPLIVRREFLPKSALRAGQSQVGVLLSGSEIEKEFLMSVAERNRLTVIAPSVNPDAVPSRADKLDCFDFVIVQGGLSSISECIARDKYMLVLPIAAHPEQILNAREVQRLGRGLHVSRQDFSDFDKLLTTAQREREKMQPVAVECNGAEVVARLLRSQFAV